MRLATKFLLIVLSIAFTGCAHAPRIDFQTIDRSLLTGKSIGVVTLPPPDLTVATAAGAAYSALAKLPPSTGQGTAKSIFEKFNFGDPAISISNNISNALVQKFGLVYSDSNKHIANTGDIAEIATKFSNYDYIVYSYTSLLQMNYFSFDWIHYRIMYGSSVHIIDVKNKTLMTKANCFINANEEGGEPTFDEMFANEGLKLKEELSKHTVTCTELALKRFNI